VSEALLEVRDLSVRFVTDDGATQAVDRFSFSLAPGEVLGIVGESGCGKSVTMMSLLRLLPETAVVTGEAVDAGLVAYQMQVLVERIGSHLTSPPRAEHAAGGAR